MAPKKKEPAARTKKAPTPDFPELEAHRHQDSRKNIPTEELRDFVAEDESKPPKMLYPRDPSLDPQLVCQIDLWCDHSREVESCPRRSPSMKPRPN